MVNKETYSYVLNVLLMDADAQPHITWGGVAAPGGISFREWFSSRLGLPYVDAYDLARPENEDVRRWLDGGAAEALLREWSYGRCYQGIV